MVVKPRPLQDGVARVRHRCLDQLRLDEFKRQKLAMLKDDDKAGGGPVVGGGSPYDNIFRTLMNEIATLEINQSIFDVYISSLHACVVQVVDEMRAESDRHTAELHAEVDALSFRLHRLTEVNESYLEKLGELEQRIVMSAAAYFISVCSIAALLLLVCCQLANGNKRGQK